MRLSAPSGRGTRLSCDRPAHEVIGAFVADLREAQAAIEAERRIELLHMDRQRLAGGGRLVEEILHQRGAEAAAAVLGQERNVDDAVLTLPAIEIEPPYPVVIAQHQEKVGGPIVLLVMRMLRIEL